MMPRRVKALLRHRFAALVDDEYRRVVNDNVVLRTQVRRYETALAGATADLQEETAARIKAEEQARALEDEVNSMCAVVKRVSQQRDNMHRERDEARADAADYRARLKNTSDAYNRVANDLYELTGDKVPEAVPDAG